MTQSLNVHRVNSFPRFRALVGEPRLLHPVLYLLSTSGSETGEIIGRELTDKLQYVFVFASREFLESLRIYEWNYKHLSTMTFVRNAKRLLSSMLDFLCVKIRSG